MGSSMIVSIILNSSKAMMKLLIISIVGILAAKYPKNDPILSPTALKNISRLSNIILLPCLIIKSLGGTINTEILLRIGILTFFCFIINSISYIICDVIGYRIHDGAINGDRTSALYISIKIAAGNGNAIGLPILVMQVLCQDSLINADFDDDSGKCYEEASSMIFVYMIVWLIMFWGYSFPTLQNLKQQEIESGTVDLCRISTEETGSKTKTFAYLEYVKQLATQPAYQQQLWISIRKIIVNPAILAVFVALLVGLISPIQNQFFAPEGSFSMIGSSLDTIGEPVVALNTLVMAASLAQCNFPVDKIQKYFDTFLFENTTSHEGKASSVAEISVRQPTTTLLRSVDNINSRTSDATLSIGGEHINDFAVESQAKFLKEEQTKIQESTPQGNLDIAESHVGTINLPPIRSVLALIMSRLILPPVVMLILNPLFMSIGLISRSQRLMLLIIMLESCSPSAQVLIVALNQLGMSSIASSMSYMYVYLYGMSIFTVTFWTTLAMCIYY